MDAALKARRARREIVRELLKPRKRGGRRIKTRTFIDGDRNPCLKITFLDGDEWLDLHFGKEAVCFHSEARSEWSEVRYGESCFYLMVCDMLRRHGIDVPDDTVE